MNHKLGMLFDFFADSQPDLSKIIDIVRPGVNSVLSLIFTLLALFCCVKCAIISYHIIRSADNPEARSEYIKSLVWPVIGLVTCGVIPPIIYIITTTVGVPSIKT